MTRINNCKFRITAQSREKGWHLKITHPEHNHEPSQDFWAHPVHQLASFTHDDQELAKNMYEAGATTRVIMTMFWKKYGSCPVTARDLYNLAAKIVTKKLGGQTSIQVLINKVDASQQSKVIFEIWINKKN